MDEQATPKNKNRRRRSRPSKSASPIQKSMTPIYQAVAGVDIGSKEHYVAVKVGDEYDVKTFGCLTPWRLD